jgi:hypothetical protein
MIGLDHVTATALQPTPTSSALVVVIGPLNSCHEEAYGNSGGSQKDPYLRKATAAAACDHQHVTISNNGVGNAASGTLQDPIPHQAAGAATACSPDIEEENLTLGRCLLRSQHAPVCPPLPSLWGIVTS